MATIPNESEPDLIASAGVLPTRVAVQPPRPAWWVIVTVGALGVVGLVVLFWFVPELVPAEVGGESVRAARTTGVATLRAAVLAGGLGLAAVLTLMFNARTAHTAEQNLHLTRQAQDDARDEAERSARATRENIRLTRRAQDDARTEARRQTHATQESLRLTRQAQVAERYSAAVELLSGGNTSSGSSGDSDGGADGTARTTAELGGIYALEQLAAEGRDYHAIVVQVLSAFVRGRAALQPDEKVGWRYYGPDREQVAPELTEPTDLDHRASTLAALSVLARVRRAVFAAPGETDPALGAAYGATSGTIFADLHETNLRAVDFTAGIGLRSGRDGRADFGSADFSGADLSRAWLLGAELGEALFRNSDLSGAVLNFADLSGASMHSAWLHGAHLEGADLSSANLSKAHGLLQKQIDYARGDDFTELPEGLQRPTSWHSTG